MKYVTHGSVREEEGLGGAKEKSPQDLLEKVSKPSL